MPDNEGMLTPGKEPLWTKTYVMYLVAAFFCVHRILRVHGLYHEIRHDIF